MQSYVFIDLVDDKDRIIRSILKSELCAIKQGYFRAVNAFVVNDKGQLWIPRRAPHKALFPLALDIGIAGYLQSGETYEQALIRKTQEDIKTDLNKLNVIFLGHITPHIGVSAFMHVYKIICNKISHYNTNDFVEYYWLYPHEIVRLIKQNEKAKTDLLPLLQVFFAPVAQ